MNSDAMGNIPGTIRVIPTNVTSGRRHLCLVRQTHSSEVAGPLAFTIV